MTNKIGIIVAPNGAHKTKADHQCLPMTISEIVNEVVACRDAGAAMVHLHARDQQGAHSLAVADNQRLLDAVQAEVGDSILIQLTTEAIGKFSPEQQMDLIRHTRPPAASFALKELVPHEQHVQVASEFFHWVTNENIISQYILYSPEDVKRYLSYVTTGVIPKQNHHLLLVLGRYQQGLQSSPKDLLPMLAPLEHESSIRRAVCAFGRSEAQCLVTSALLGQDIRVGFENNLHTIDGKLAPNNAHQVEYLKATLAQLDIQTYQAKEFKQSLCSV
ncbi:3-keto-5-aminohexanoate cleavage protein [Vibrio sp. SCSIO 43135]|uniref:3-keto-5-aminohexanoate cleavage protein n=1 Tax=Vibrio sp. SCSIO 43135 TaxID=2819096 RepID=UPI0020764E39|nr:3-keto-5-aminohexanoate cleavage protein [Vibrio sp. SCSIO 43135]USD43130.1 3-keto-5-aminohexanoate cleavage protein [Vibrio sp. SCSIO 43135]